jgi:ribosomal protein S18 acetylase RimI-like enzyme
VSGIILREGRPGDCEAVAAMARALARLAHVEAGITGAILEREAFGPRPTLAFLVAQDETGLLGCLIHQDTFSTWRGANGVFVIDLFVQPEHRGAGLGRRLLAEAARLGLSRGAAFMRLDVEPDNHAALRFYGRLGFAGVDHRLEVLEFPGMAALAAEAP